MHIQCGTTLCNSKNCIEMWKEWDNRYVDFLQLLETYHQVFGDDQWFETAALLCSKSTNVIFNKQETHHYPYIDFGYNNMKTTQPQDDVLGNSSVLNSRTVPSTQSMLPIIYSYLYRQCGIFYFTIYNCYASYLQKKGMVLKDPL